MKIAALLIYPAPILYRILAAYNETTREQINLFYQYEVAEIRPGYDWQRPVNLSFAKLDSVRRYRELLSFDIILIHGIWSNYKTFFTYFFAAIIGKTVVNLTEAENLYTIKPWQRFLKRLSVWMLPKSKTYFLCLGGLPVCINDYTKYGFLKENFKPFAYCGAINEAKTFREKKYHEGQQLRFLYAGQLHHRKGLDVLMQALSETNKVSYILHVCGMGQEEQQLKALSRTLKINHKIKFDGHLDASALEKAYSDADVFVLPSRFDGYGAVLNEAASFSLPLIASDNVMSHFELIEHRKNGFVFKDKEELVSILNNLAKNPEMLSAMRKASFMVSKRFTPNALAEKLDQYLKEITDDKSYSV